jgi:PAS domain S-box-containing protein
MSDTLRELEESRAQLDAILSSAMDAIISVDDSFTIVQYNAAAERVLLCPAGEAMGGGIDRFIPGRFRHSHAASMEAYARGTIVPRNMGAQREIRVLRADGSEFVAEASISHTIAAGRRLFTVVLRDATPRLENEARLRELNETLESRVLQRTDSLLKTIAELEAFCYTISHDLRAPLRAIDGYAQMVLEDEPGLGADGRRHLQLAREGAQTMSRLIDGLLAFARLSNAQLTPERVEMGELAAQVVEQMRAEGNLGLARVDIGALPATRGDRAMLRQVLHHLLSNAVKFSSRAAQPRVEAGCVTGERGTEIFVKDNGAGFDMRYAGKLFGVFQRLHHASEFEGLGVGLAMAGRILELHGQRIRAQSAPGEGAILHFSIEPDAGPAPSRTGS